MVFRPVRVFACAVLLLAEIGIGVAHADDSVHVVQSGETLSQIAADLGVDQDALLKLNALDDPNVLSIGQSLKLPRAAASAGLAPVAAAPAPAASTSSYTVADGDTLWDIAMRFSTTTAMLVDANKLEDPDRLVLGTQLVIPGAAPARPSGASAPVAQSTPAPSPTPTPPAARSARPATGAKRSLLVPYTVQPGETLTQIARQFGLRADAIAQSSGLDDANRLSIGQVLKLPLPGHEHVVVAGETLRDIALQEKVDLGSLIDFNELDDPELIRVGQVVLVPPGPGGGAPIAKSASTPGPAAAAPAQVAAAQPAAPVAAAPAAAAAAVQNQVAAAAKPTPTPARRPLAVVKAPPGAPTDGLAGAGLKLLGSAYVWGGSSPSGFDCSGYIWYVARQAGRPLSRGMLGQYNSGSHPGRDELKVGDLVFFQNTYSAGLSHNGIYIGNGQFVHAADEAAGVTISSLNTAYWASHWFGATRLP